MAKKENNRMIPDLELTLETTIGKLTGVFLSTPINCYQNVYTAYLKEKPSVIVQADSIGGSYRLPYRDRYESILLLPNHINV